MNKKIIMAVLIVLSFVGGSLSPRPNGLNQDQECNAETSTLKKDQGYKAGPYTVVYRTYMGRSNKIYYKIDIKGKRDLKGGIYKKGATIEERK